MKDKKGVEIAISTVLIIILSLAVLSILLIYFNTQGGIFSSKLKEQTSQSNVDSFVSSCNSLLDLESYYSYCCDEKEVKFYDGEDLKSVKISCFESREYSWSKERVGLYECSSFNC